MEPSVPELMDLSGGTEETFRLYGEDVRQPGSFAACCLTTRRLVTCGVHNIQMFHRGWDAHDYLPKERTSQCKDIDQGCAALITDLKQRGMLEDILVIWGESSGEPSTARELLLRTLTDVTTILIVLPLGWLAEKSNQGSPMGKLMTTSTTSPIPTE